MLTTWEYSAKTEAERLIHVAYHIANGFFKVNNFLVLPYDGNLTNPSVVTFPDLPYGKVSRFWKMVKTVKIDNLPLIIDKKFVNEIECLIVGVKIREASFEKVKKLWEKVEDEVLDEVYKVIPSKAHLIKKITICPTVFGTNCSFNWSNDFGEIFVYWRDDQGIHAIVEAIVSSITRKDVYEKLGGVWAESEIVADYLITQTSIATVLQKYENADLYLPTLKGILLKGIRGKEQVKLMQESERFYKKLGISTFEKPFVLNGLTPHIFDKPLENLTETEKNLTITLIRNENQITDFDTIGEAIFKTEDDFSLYAISKTIQRLRDKLEANGISGSYIQTLRGKGYLLRN